MVDRDANRRLDGSDGGGTRPAIQGEFADIFARSLNAMNEFPLAVYGTEHPDTSGCDQ